MLASISELIDTHSIVVSQERVRAIPVHHHFPEEAAYPLLLADLLPECERVLFLDADLLVLDDLSALWETSLGECALGAVQDSAIPFCCSPRGVKRQKELGIPEDTVYFNGGVLLLQLGRWRERAIARRAYAYLRSVGERVDFLHQEALNAVLWNDWMPLPRRWNLVASLTGRRYTSTNPDWENPGIVHFAGRFKPWRAPVGGPFDAYYREILQSLRPYVPSAKARPADKLLSFYDRHLRDLFYKYERILWTRRLI